MLVFFSAFMAVAAAGPQAAKPVEQDPVICTRPSDEHSVGTRMRPRKVCKRQSEWQALDQRTQRAPDQDKQRAGTSAPLAGAGGGRQ